MTTHAEDDNDNNNIIFIKRPIHKSTCSNALFTKVFTQVNRSIII